jgi:ribosomal protein S18 acetylase RimI-like enzyme
MHITIEQVSLEHSAEIIFGLVKSTFVRTFDPPTKDVDVVKRYLSDCVVYLVKDGDTPIGYFGFHLESTSSVELKSIALLPSYQNKGIGRQMLATLFDATRGRKIWLVVHPQNSHAIMTYLKNDFTILNWKQDFFGDGEPRLVMERK